MKPMTGGTAPKRQTKKMKRTLPGLTKRRLPETGMMKQIPEPARKKRIPKPVRKNRAPKKLPKMKRTDFSAGSIKKNLQRKKKN